MEEEQQKELEIPVLSVWKNNSILKNIYLVNSPPLSSQENGEKEEILVVGRHPDCEIRVEHPSISRFHLRLHSIPTLHLLFLTDLSSVHGTFVSGRRIEPNVRTPLKESDTLRIGGSSRVYKLHWIPLSKAYDVSNPFVPPLDLAAQQEAEDEENIEDECSLGLENEVIQAVDSVSKGLDMGDDNKLVVEQISPVTKQNISPKENERLDSKFPDMEGLMSLFLGEFSQVNAQEEVPPDPTSAKVNSELVVNEVIQPLDYVLEGLAPLFLGENWEWVGQEENYMLCPTDEDYPHPVNHVDMGSIVSTSEDSDNYEKSELEKLDVQKVVPFVPSVLECISAHMTPPNLDVSTARNSSGMVCNLIQNEEVISLLDEDSRVSQDTTDNSKFDVQKLVPSMPSMLENMTDHMKPNLVSPTAGESSKMASELSYNEEQSSMPEGETQVLDGLDTSENCESVHRVIPSVTSMPEDITFHVAPNLDIPTAGRRSRGMKSEFVQNEEQISLLEENTQDDMWNFWCGSLVAPASLATENNRFDKDNQLSESEPEALSERQCLGSVHVHQNSTTEDRNGSKLWSFWSGNMGIESSVCSSLSDAESILESENKTLGTGVQSPPFSLIKRPIEGSPLVTSDEKSSSCIWSRRGILRSAPQILTTRSEEKKLRSGQKNAKHEPLYRALFNENNVQEEEEIFTPDKENVTPNTHRSMRKLAMLKDVKISSPGRSPNLKMTGSPKVCYEDSTSHSSNKENYSPRTLLLDKTASRASVNQGKSIQLREGNRKERMPFHSLLADSPQNSANVTCFQDAAMTKDNFTSERTQKWNMIVDTTTLLNKKSRMALQLLEGLKGTQLIIPKIVIKDLVSLKRQTSFFRRNTEVASALDWIEDCMVKTHQWVHVQNSTEGSPVAPTPPASPYSQASCGTTAGHFIFASTFETQPEIISPTVEDHVLDYALSFKKIKDDGQLVLLSNDVTLKIKAMAKGIICETAEEFRESLVNPFSERFLWADSSPRGQTWSCSDDFVLRERFYPSSLQMTPKATENVKGLKLILLHNSQYFKQMAAIH